MSRDINDSGTQFTGQVVSHGRDGPTRADSAKADTILQVLQGKSDLFSGNPWIKNLWDPPGGLMLWPERLTPRNLRPIKVPKDPKVLLNPSQIHAIEKMLSQKDQDRIILIRGPPGSGKTS